MGNREINKKRRLLELIDDYQLSNGARIHCTLDGFVDLLKKDIKNYDDDKRVREEQLIKDFTDIYLKKYSDDGLIVGKELLVIHITSLKVDGYTDRYERIYKCEGSRISFNRVNVLMDDKLYPDHMREETLRSYEVIDKEQYDEFVEKYNAISGNIDKIIGE